MPFSLNLCRGSLSLTSLHKPASRSCTTTVQQPEISGIPSCSAVAWSCSISTPTDGRTCCSWMARTGGLASGRKHGLYRNNHDGTFKDVLAGSGLDAVDVYGLGASVADLRQRRPRRCVHDDSRWRTPLPQRRARQVRRRDGGKRAFATRDFACQRRLARLRPRRAASICSSAIT